jgi:hypothetical protein
LVHDQANLGLASLDTVAGFAFSCNYVPGAADDTAFVAMVKSVNQNVDPRMRMLSSMRRLFFECYSLAADDIRSRAERCEDAPVRKLAGPERLSRYDVLQLRLKGLLLEVDAEPSNAIVDYISQRLKTTRSVIGPVARFPWRKVAVEMQSYWGRRLTTSSRSAQLEMCCE